MPLLHQYASPVPNITLGEVGLLLISGLSIIDYLRYEYRFKLSPYLLFIYSMFVTSGLGALIEIESFAANDVIKLCLRLVFYYIILIFPVKIYFQYELGVKIYFKLIIFCSVILILQVIFYYAFSFIIPSTIPFLPLYNNVSYGLIDFEKVYSQLFRPQSIFLEPGVFAQFLLPGLILSLFKFNQKRDFISIKRGIFISLVLILTLSSQAIALTIFIWLLYIIKTLKKSGFKKIFKIVIFSIFIFTIFISLIVSVEPLRKATIGRYIEKTTYNSTDVRVYRGFQVYSELDPVHKLIGVGFGNVTSYVKSNNITTKSDLYAVDNNGNKLFNYEYMNSIAYILVTGGLVTFLFFSYFMFDIFKKSKGFSKIALIVMFIMCIYGGILISSTWILFFTFIFSEINSRESKSH